MDCPSLQYSCWTQSKGVKGNATRPTDIPSLDFVHIAVLRIRIFFDRIQIRTCIHKPIIERSQSITFSRLYTTFSLIYNNMFKRKQWLMFVFFSEFKNAQNLIIPMEVVNVEAEKIFRFSFDWTKKMPRDNSNLVICNVWKWHFMYLCWLWWKKIIQTEKIVRKCNNTCILHICAD